MLPEDFDANGSVLAFVKIANSNNIQVLVTADAAKAHIEEQLTSLASCSIDREFALTARETIIPREDGVAGEIYSITGATLSVSKTGVCALTSPEGWSGSCSITGSDIAVSIGDNSQILTGTIANNRVSLVAMPGLSSTDDGTGEYVSVSFDGKSNAICSEQEVTPGSYNFAGTEAVSMLDGSGYDVYSVIGTITIDQDSCTIEVTEEGEVPSTSNCQVIGNQILGTGESAIIGTITNSQVTMFYNDPGSDGEIVVAYFNGNRNTNPN